MIFRNFSILLMVFVGLFKPFAVYAQSCEIIPATITTMNEPDIGAYNLWDSVYGDFESEEKFVSALYQGEDFILLGTKKRADKARLDLSLVRIDKRGREVWAQSYQVDGLLAVHRILPHPNGYIVLGTVNTGGQIQSAKVWFGFFDRDGQYLSQSFISEDNGGIFGNDLVAMGDTGLYAVASHIKRGTEIFDTVVYVVDSKGKRLRQRVYRSGANNRILKLFNGSLGRIIGVGQTQDAYNRSNGWVVSLDYDLRLGWSQSYPRGTDSALYSGVAFEDNSLVVVGKAQPTDGELMAAWAMRLDAGSGDVVWERYYRGGRDYTAVDVLATDDGVLSLALNGYNFKTDKVLDEVSALSTYDFVRLLTLNRRGEALFSEDYLNAKGTGVSEILFGNYDERVFFGWTRSPQKTEGQSQAIVLGFMDDQAGEEMSQKPVSVNGWVLSTPGTDPYKDPCER